MAYTHTRFGSALAILLLGSTALGGTAQAWSLFGDSKKDAKKETTVEAAKSTPVQPAETLDGSIRQAQLLRVDGNYSEAVRHLSQLMMVASDDSRVISEYGKTLAAMGRASEAVSFLTRAIQLQPGDWTVHSALGVAYDQTGNQEEARKSYEQALALKPGEPAVLNNYALSRMLAKDPEGARNLVARAEIAGGTSDPKIARNIAMIRETAPAAPASDYAVTNPAPSPVPRTAVAAAPLPPAPARIASGRSTPSQRVAASAAPRPVQPAPFVDLPTPPPMPAPVNLAPAAPAIIQAQPQMAQAPRPVPQGVVMQRVPVDPLAGPVAVAIPNPPAATRAPRSLTPNVARAETRPAPVAVASKAAEDLHAKAEALARQMDAEKASNKQAAARPAPQPRVLPPAPKAAEAKPAPQMAAAKAANDLQARADAIAKQMEAEKASNQKAAAKPAAADAKPVAAKTAAKPAKDSVPALRLSANAY